MQRGTPPSSATLVEQAEARLTRGAPPLVESPIIIPDDATLVSTGSTLLDMAISGSRFPRGGLPGGIMVEIFGPSGCGKTVLLSEIAGNVQQLGGEVMFKDPEGRLNGRFAQMFGLKIENTDYSQPDTVTEVFRPLTAWEPKQKKDVVHGIFVDSLAALSTQMEMDDADKMGMRRAKEFSEGCRKTCRILPARNILMVCSNQVRQNNDAGPYSEKYTTPGGMAIGFYSSVRLRCHSPIKITRERDIGARKEKRVIGVQTTIDVYKNSIAAPYQSANVHIQFDYGIDDIRANLEFLKSTSGISTYNVLGDMIKLGNSMERAIKEVEDHEYQKILKDRTIEVWHEVNAKFKVERLSKQR